jgi:hypothetical protein
MYGRLVRHQTSMRCSIRRAPKCAPMPYSQFCGHYYPSRCAKAVGEAWCDGNRAPVKLGEHRCQAASPQLEGNKSYPRERCQDLYNTHPSKAEALSGPTCLQHIQQQQKANNTDSARQQPDVKQCIGSSQLSSSTHHILIMSYYHAATLPSDLAQ